MDHFGTVMSEDRRRRVSGYLEGDRLEKFEKLEDEHGGQSKALRHIIDRLDRVDELEEERDWLRDLVDDLRDRD